MELLGMQVVLTCQRIDCDAQLARDLDDFEPLAMVGTIKPERIADGWGFDQEGFNRVLHCPAHRTSKES